MFQHTCKLANACCKLLNMKSIKHCYHTCSYVLFLCLCMYIYMHTRRSHHKTLCLTALAQYLLVNCCLYCCQAPSFSFVLYNHYTYHEKMHPTLSRHALDKFWSKSFSYPKTAIILGNIKGAVSQGFCCFRSILC